MKEITEVISGGQTGAERAALDAAIRYDLAHSGWCAKGRKAEDGIIASQYNLKETPRNQHIQYIERNARDSDGTVIFTLSSKLTGDCKKSALFAETFRKPWIHIAGSAEINPAQSLQKFVEENGVTRLNVAGSRKSAEPGIYRWVYDVIEDAFLWGIRNPVTLVR